MLQRLTFALLGKLKPYNYQLIARVKWNPSGAFKETLFKRGINVIHCSLCEFEIETCRKLSYYRILLMYCRRLRNKVFDVNLILAREVIIQWETIRTFVASLLLHLPLNTSEEKSWIWYLVHFQVSMLKSNKELDLLSIYFPHKVFISRRAASWFSLWIPFE